MIGGEGKELKHTGYVHSGGIRFKKLRRSDTVVTYGPLREEASMKYFRT